MSERVTNSSSPSIVNFKEFIFTCYAKFQNCSTLKHILELLNFPHINKVNITKYSHTHTYTHTHIRINIK